MATRIQFWKFTAWDLIAIVTWAWNGALHGAKYISAMSYVLHEAAAPDFFTVSFSFQNGVTAERLPSSGWFRTNSSWQMAW